MKKRIQGSTRGCPQGGFVLIELLAAGLIVVLLSVWAAHAWAQRVRDLQAQSLAEWMLVAQDAAQAFLRQHGGLIAQAAGTADLVPHGYADWSAPTWAELRSVGLVPVGWAESGPLGQSLGLRVLRAGACPGAACQVTMIVHTQRPLLDRQGLAIDEGMVAQWLLAARGQGLVIWPQSAGVLSGAGRRLPVPDGWAPGTLALALGAGSAGAGGPVDLSAYLKVQDERDPQFQGDATVQGSIRSGKSLRARDYLVLEGSGFEHGSCTDEGAVTLDSMYDGMLRCREGRWRSMGRAPGGGFMLNSSSGCFDPTVGYLGNPLTGDCSCPFNYVPVMVSKVGGIYDVGGQSLGYVCVPMG